MVGSGGHKVVELNQEKGSDLLAEREDQAFATKINVVELNQEKGSGLLAGREDQACGTISKVWV
jgi:hypothetical protein